MPKIIYTGYWSREWQKKYKIPIGSIYTKPDEMYLKDLYNYFTKLDNDQKENDRLRKLKITIEYYYEKRSLKMNNLTWSLYEIEANEQNAGMVGHSQQTVTPQELYENDLKEYAPKFQVRIKKSKIDLLRRTYKRYEIVKESETHYDVIITIGQSQFDTMQMSQWIERQFNRIAYNGVSIENASDIKNYWLKWKQHLNDNEITLYDDILSQKEYKDLNPICEACGEFIQEGRGELAHIQSIGMGGNAEPEKNYSSNWLHLHANPCHRKHWHEQGVETFLKKYPALKYKVSTALKRDYKPLPEWNDNFLDIF